MRNPTKTKYWLASTLALGLLSGCSDSSDSSSPTPSATQSPVSSSNQQLGLVPTLKEDTRFSTLVAALEATDLLGVLNSADFTVFAPTDEAFAKLPEGTLDALLADPDTLKEILLFHVVSGQLKADKVLASSSLTAANELSLAIRTEGGKAFIQDAQIIATDLQTDNGVIHAIDSVMLPTSIYSIAELAAQTADLSTLLTAVKAAGLAETLTSGGPFTVFAPIDSAFAELGEETITSLLENPEALANILTYHVVEGSLDAAAVIGSESLTTIQGQQISVSSMDGNFFINDAKILATDVVAKNGVVHLIDGVLLPAEKMSAPAPKSILEIATANENFSTLASLLEAADLIGALQGEGPFTVFAPTNEAFEKIPAETLEALGNDKEALTKVLLYHVAAAKLLASDVLSGAAVATLADGLELNARLDSNGDAFINDSKLLATDIVASNGVIHVIDTVLLPPMMEETPSIVDIAVGAENFTTLVALLQKANLVDVLQGEGPFTVFAPTDAAFAALPADLRDAVVSNPELLTKVLTYHVVPGAFDAKAVASTRFFKTAQGEKLDIRRTFGGGLKAAGAGIIATDIVGSNGIIHVIDSVMLPPSLRH